MEEPAEESVEEPVEETVEEDTIELNRRKTNRLSKPEPEPESEPEPEPEADVILNDKTLEEVYISNSQDMESVNMELNDEDYYILFKVVQTHIKDHFSNSLTEIFEQKKIQTRNLDMHQIVYDSDENEESEDELLENNEFEESYDKIV